MFKRTILAVATTVALVGGLSGSAQAVDGNIPASVGGGTFSVELADFTYPATNGCYQPDLSFLRVTATNDFAYTYYVLDLTVRDSIGRVADTFFEMETYSGTYPLSQQFCPLFDAPGTYTATGVLRFETTRGSYSVPVSDTYTLTGYTKPVVAAPAPPAPPKVSKKCTNAKAALKKAKKQNKPYKVIQAAQKKKNKVC